MKKAIIIIVFLFLGILIGWFLFGPSFPGLRNETTEDVDVVLNRIQQVTKLVTVEGSFSEIYTYENFWGYKISPLKKKALVRVKAEVIIGYNLNDVNFLVDNEEKEIIIEDFPDPRILSVDKSLDYYDIQEGTFNQFTEKDFTNIDKRVDGLIRSRAAKSDLFRKADDQLRNILQTMSILASDAGYTLVYSKAGKEDSTGLLK